MNSDDELDDADLQAEIELDDADLQAEIERLQNEVAEPYDDLDSGDNGYEDTPLSVLQVLGTLKHHAFWMEECVKRCEMCGGVCRNVGRDVCTDT